jgi:hypothetical protein
MKHSIVEVSVINADGDPVPVGLMNTEQALSLPEEMDIKIFHPENQADGPEALMDRSTLQRHVARKS